ncbi:MAG: hypothetical protein M5U34_19525 [Chloroflexi bacterium]|nr:hypothetical protein [Chloroflexota bacterium]
MNPPLPAEPAPAEQPTEETAAAEPTAETAVTEPEASLSDPTCDEPVKWA